nr:polygalacturonase inhibitor [Quercus suber]
MGASFVAHVLFLLWFFATTFSFFLKAESNVSCNEKDKQALLNFKQCLSDPQMLSSWSDQEDCSKWGGVVYDNKTGRVTELHLNEHIGQVTGLSEIRGLGLCNYCAKRELVAGKAKKLPPLGVVQVHALQDESLAKILY